MQSDFVDQLKTFPAVKVSKGTVLVSPGQLADSFFYVEKGCLRSYLLDRKGKEHVFQFAPEDWIISDEEALSEHKPAILYIDAIEDSVVRVIKSSFQENMTNFEKDFLVENIQKLTRKINALRRRIFLLLNSSAEERYTTFVSTYPGLAQRVPLKMIASYLGITPESLSRVRKELAHKK